MRCFCGKCVLFPLCEEFYGMVVLSCFLAGSATVGGCPSCRVGVDSREDGCQDKEKDGEVCVCLLVSWNWNGYPPHVV